MGERWPRPPPCPLVASAHHPGQAAGVAVAALGATGLALALVVGLAGAPAKPAWSMTAGNVQ